MCFLLAKFRVCFLPRLFRESSLARLVRSKKNFHFFKEEKSPLFPLSRQRPHRGESTGSRQITAVKRRRAPPVPGWVTAREPGVALASFLSVRGPVWAPFFITRYQGARLGSLFCHSLSGGPVGLPFLSLVIRGPGRAPFFVTRNRPSLSLSVFEPRPPVPGVPLSS